MPESKEDTTKRVGKWYFGGAASAGAACITHPLDLLKVHLQTQQKGKVGLLEMGVKVVRSDGIFGLYNGLTASLLRQLTYSLTRFGIYETVKKQTEVPGRSMAFYEKVLLGGFAGCVGGLVGTPADLINVRMQNDVKLAPESRRNYKHAIDGLYKVIKHEGPIKLMNGATMASLRATFVTIGQISFYDQFKVMLLRTGFFQDNVITHFSASFMAGGVATLLTMPLDVMKTRMMNAPPGTYSGIFACAKDIGKNGPMGFFKGFIPAFVRLGPHTIITFLLFEQLRLQFGDVVPK
ncbi:hypothetical protein HELRODRAFT_184909 [Helobdella robusta]|uniref:Mitochondrial dicarboxylate carrier n=1 Tax=Helobdella robusta TaxID=6412 RepID=T1FM59_HELRO|nr:hypothetical protein HELRODRAFT_184909 [Helobdella robusta]ESO05963.1 hypothetical protein HELRODRAFT_184909 [Helobdella robusta]